MRACVRVCGCVCLCVWWGSVYSIVYLILVRIAANGSPLEHCNKPFLFSSMFHNNNNNNNNNLTSHHWSLFLAITFQFTNTHPTSSIFTLIPLFFPFASMFSNRYFQLRIPHKILLRILFSQPLGPCSAYPLIPHLTTTKLEDPSYGNSHFTISLMLLQLSLSLSHTN